MKSRPTHYTETSVKQSLEVRDNVASNLSRYLGMKGRSVQEFLKWVEEQTCPEVSPRRFLGWPYVGTTYVQNSKKHLVSDPFIMYLLVANYIGKDIRDVISGKIPHERL